jgi:hypothetical protein
MERAFEVWRRDMWGIEKDPSERARLLACMRTVSILDVERHAAEPAKCVMAARVALIESDIEAARWLAHLFAAGYTGAEFDDVSALCGADNVECALRKGVDHLEHFLSEELRALWTCGR